MQTINFLDKTFGHIGMLQSNTDFELYGTLLEGDYCLNWRRNKRAKKIEMYLFTPLLKCKCDYQQEQNLLIERFKKSELVDKVVRKGTKRIDIYLKQQEVER